MVKRESTPKQLANLKKGREIQFQNELKKRGINPNPQPRVIEKIVKQPVYLKSNSSNNVTFSLFDQFLGVKLFPIEINNKKENLNLNQIIKQLIILNNRNIKEITSIRQKTKEIILYVNFQEKKISEQFKALELRISKLEKENNDLKEQVNEL